MACSAPALHFTTHAWLHPGMAGVGACLLLHQRFAPHGGQAVVMDAVNDQPPPVFCLVGIGVVEDEERRRGEAAGLQGAALQRGRRLASG